MFLLKTGFPTFIHGDHVTLVHWFICSYARVGKDKKCIFVEIYRMDIPDVADQMVLRGVLYQGDGESSMDGIA
jgi:hypothetical protein